MCEAQTIRKSADSLEPIKPDPDRLYDLAQLINRWIRTWSNLCDTLQRLPDGTNELPLVIENLDQDNALGRADEALSGIRPLITHHNLALHLSPFPSLTISDRDSQVVGLPNIKSKFNDFMDEIRRSSR